MTFVTVLFVLRRNSETLTEFCVIKSMVYLASYLVAAFSATIATSHQKCGQKPVNRSVE